MAYIPPEIVKKAEKIDLLTYLRVLYTRESSSIDVGVHRR